MPGFCAERRGLRIDRTECPRNRPFIHWMAAVPPNPLYMKAGNCRHRGISPESPMSHDSAAHGRFGKGSKDRSEGSVRELLCQLVALLGRLRVGAIEADIALGLREVLVDVFIRNAEGTIVAPGTVVARFGESW